jgi:CheY-like chemotaxis protein
MTSKLKSVFGSAFSEYEALNRIEKYTREAVLSMLDINMPGMSSLELLDRIKQKILRR